MKFLFFVQSFRLLYRLCIVYAIFASCMIRPLTSLRLFFALMVFVSHCTIVSSVFETPLMNEGYVGVSFFFVLSGFIISYSYDARFREGSVCKRNFWVARIARIYPLHVLMLMVTAVLGTYTMARGWGDWLCHFVANLFLCQAYVPDAGYYFSFNSPAWSLCCEQLFYLCFPFMMPLLRKPRRLALLFAVYALAVVVGMGLTSSMLAKDIWYVNPLARFPDFILGMLVYVCYRRYPSLNCNLGWGTSLELLVVGLFVTFYVMSSSMPQVYRYSCYYWLPIALVIYVFSVQCGALSRLLSCRMLVWGGEVSFGFYLLHHLLFRLYVEAERYLAFAVSPYVAVLLVLVATMVLSAVSYRYFEQPMNRFVKQLFWKKK